MRRLLKKITNMKLLLNCILLLGIAGCLACSDTDKGKNMDPTTEAAPVQVIAHRGGARLAPENTLAAFRKALELGVDMIEIDVILSADPAIIVIHDDQIDRTTDGEGVVKQLSLAEIKSYDAGSWFGEEFAGERIPTLDEVLELINGQATLLIEIKDGDEEYPGLERMVVDAIHRYKANDWVVVQSFNEQSVIRVRRLDPSLITYYLMGGNFEAFYEKLKREPLPEPLPYHGVAVHHAQIDSTKALTLREAGYQLFVWTVNEPADMERLLAIHPAGIITDLPDKLQELMAGRQQAD